MPNWCENILKITGPAKEVARFKKAVRGKGKEAKKNDQVLFSFDSLVPLPKAMEEGERWYHWRIANWGTKWEASDARLISNDKTCVEYGFNTAWSPPMEWVATVGQQFQDLTFRLWYAEGGMSFAGVYTVHGAECGNEEKDYVEAQIEERGSISVQCGVCDEDMEISSKDAVRICEECVLHRCDNCGKQDDAHVEGKCPFDSTMFKHISTEKIDGGSE